MPVLLLNHRGREEECEDRAQPELVAYVQRCRGVEVIQHELDPLVEGGGAETAEIFAEGKVAQDVEACEMIPLTDLDFIVVFVPGFVAKALDEEIEEASEDRFLLEDRFLRKGWVEGSTEAAVALVVCECDGMFVN